MASSPSMTSTTTKTYDFGPYKIPESDVFLETPHSLAFVNLKPVLPGHVLVMPRRVLKRFADLSSDEVSDLWLTAQRVGRAIEPHFNATSLTFAIQDGAQAGQTVPHVHIHILPRKPADFKNMDDVYDELDKSEKEMGKKLDLDEERRVRTPIEMAAEADELRRLFV